MRVALSKNARAAGLAGMATLYAVALTAALLPGQAAAAAPLTPVSGKVIVTFKAGVDADAVAREYKGKGAGLGAVWRHALNGAALELPPGLAKKLAEDRRVAAVEADGVVSSHAAPWDLDRLDQPARPLDGVYNPATTGKGVDIYVIDGGVRSTHTEFTGRMKPGYDALGAGTTEDCKGHGSMVAGLSAGKTYGAAPGAFIIPVRTQQCDGSGSNSVLINGLNWVIAQHTAGTPAVMNISIGGGASTSVDSAVRAAVADGIVVVVSAGNKSADSCSYSPSREPLAITVGATDSGDALASFSNRGSCVDLQAPGAGVVTAYNTSDTATTGGNGTSFSAPLVAGAAALLLETNPTATPAEIGASLLAATVPAAVVPSGTTSSFLQVRKAASTTVTPVLSPSPSPTAATSSPSASPSASAAPSPSLTATPPSPAPTVTTSPSPSQSGKATKTRGGGGGGKNAGTDRGKN